MTPRDRVDWRTAPPISDEFRDYLERLDRELRSVQLRAFPPIRSTHGVSTGTHPTELVSVIPSQSPTTS